MEMCPDDGEDDVQDDFGFFQISECVIFVGVVILPRGSAELAGHGQEWASWAIDGAMGERRLDESSSRQSREAASAGILCRCGAARGVARPCAA